MGGDVFSVMDAFDAVFVLPNYLELIMDKWLDMTILTDSRKVFDTVTRGNSTQGRRLGIDIVVARHLCKVFNISLIGLIRGAVNPSEGLTKEDGNGALRLMRRTGHDSTPVYQWIES